MDQYTLAKGILLLSLASCSFDASVSHTASSADAGINDDGSNPDFLPSALSIIDLSIGQGGDFPSYDSWKNARAGDLTTRQLVQVAEPATFVAGEEVSSTSGSCSGIFRAASATPISTSLVTLDVESGACLEGDTLVSEGGTRATIQMVGPIGIREVGTVISAMPAPLQIDSFQSSADHFLTLQASPQTPHLGLPGQGITIQSTNGQPHNGIEVEVPFTRITGFEITQWATNADENTKAHAVHVRASQVILDRLLIHADGSTHVDSESDAVYSDEDDVELTLRNSFVYDVGRAGLHIDGVKDAQLNVENCSFANCMLVASGSDRFACITAGESSGSILRVVNTVALSSTPGRSAFFIPADAEGSAFSLDSSNNASNESTGPGSVALIDESEFVSLTPGAVDLHLASEGVLAIGGSPLESSFDHDIDGDPRSRTWSIGADQTATAPQ